MRYIKEIIKAIRDHRRLPSLNELYAEHDRWTYYLKEKDALKNEIPWITFKAMDYISNYLNKEMKVFEFGGGGSTLFFNSKVKELVTVEHDKNWFDALRREMDKRSKVQWQGLFKEAQEKTSLEELDKANPDHYYSEDASFRSKNFFNYATAIDSFPDQYFDLVLIDGRARPSCLKHSLQKVKKGGLLVLDNSDREYYLEQFKGKLGDYELISDHFGPTPYVTWFTQTHIWKRVL